MIAGVLLAVATLASMIPAWRAVQVSPSQALQSD
jgi:ABC-type lipoprotein release transport system permease subunit